VILIVGDIIVDEFTYGKAIGISAETPTVVAEEIEIKRMYGGAALVQRHLKNLGEKSVLISMGPSTNTDASNTNIKIVGKAGWKTTTKKRYFVDDYKMVQYDIRNKASHDAISENQLKEIIKREILENDIKIVVVADNRHGTINAEIAKWLVCQQEVMNYKLYADSQFSQEQPNHNWYKGCYTMFLNKKETNFWLKDLVCGGLDDLSEELDCNIICKLGDQGAEAFIDGKLYQEKALDIDVVDTCGAGDAFLAAYVNSNAVCPENKLKDANNYATKSCAMKGTEVPDV